MAKKDSKERRGKKAHKASAKSDDKRAAPVQKERTMFVDHGNFSHGICAGCSWQGPGRRARSRAIEDATEHVKDCKKAKATSKS